MAFQIKTFAAIAASMLNHARASTTKLSDWIPGSVARTIIEAPAVEIEELYIQFFNGVREAIPTVVFEAFDFDTLPAMYAVGIVTVSKSPPPSANLLVPIGTVFKSNDGRQYMSTANRTWIAGNASVKIPVQAEAIGSFYNISANSITSSPFFDANYTVGNEAITTGREVETQTEREDRFGDYLASLSSGTVPACVYAVRSAVIKSSIGEITEYVTRVGVVEVSGWVRFYIYTSKGVASNAIVAAAQLLLDGVRDGSNITAGVISGGVKGTVVKMTQRVVPMGIAVGLFDGYELDDDLKIALLNVYNSNLSAVSAGGTLHLGNLETDFLGIAGIEAVIIDTSPAVGEDLARNIVCGENEVLIGGQANISGVAEEDIDFRVELITE